MLNVADAICMSSDSDDSGGAASASEEKGKRANCIQPKRIEIVNQILVMYG